jgi:hypothetical protein
MLGRVVDRWPGARLCLKPRVADVLAIDGSGITAEQYSYALKAHFDFIVCRHDAQTLRDMPQFAVEFDGPQHQTDPRQIERDHHKDAICAQLGLPLVRAREPALKQIGDRALLEWLAELWFVYHDLYAALSSADEDRDPFDDEDGRLLGRFSYARIWQHLYGGGDVDRLGLDGPYDPFAVLRREFQRFVHGRKVVGMWEAYVGEDPRGTAHGAILLDLGEGRYLVGEGRCQLRHFISAPLLAQTIALDLALVQMVERARAFAAGRLAPIQEAAARDRARELQRSPLLHLPALSDDDFYEVLLSWLGPDPSERQRQEVWMFAHVERHDDDRDHW